MLLSLNHLLLTTLSYDLNSTSPESLIAISVTPTSSLVSVAINWTFSTSLSIPSGAPISSALSVTQPLTSSKSLIAITGASSSSAHALPSASSTSPTRPRPTKNAQACNGHVEFCNRRFSNISMVVAHNSPFVVPHNAASNQDVHVLTQLNDGIRGLQFETRRPDPAMKIRLCHHDCNILDVGTLESYLITVADWIGGHPYEVISIMMGNGNRIDPTAYIQPFERAGLLPLLYVPPYRRMALDQWPTLSEMIFLNKRVVVTLDYGTNQSAIPWLLDEFSYQWQTPFSPIDESFPCTVDRPANQAADISRNRMYMANHNLNYKLPIKLFPQGQDILLPAHTQFHKVNAVAGNVSLGLNVNNCIAKWGRPPNWLLVDFYNRPNGSVFQVAAAANQVSYNGACCGVEKKAGARSIGVTKIMWVVFSVMALLL